MITKQLVKVAQNALFFKQVRCMVGVATCKFPLSNEFDISFVL
jgi:hypothetical protein